MAADRGYGATFVLPDKQSEEKRSALRAWGAKGDTPTDVSKDPDHTIKSQLGYETENSVYANQYHNPSNRRIIEHRP